MPDRYDAIVIGAGHNGLVAAAYLARAGRRVLVLERREVLGGAAATEEVVPGFRFDVGAHTVSRLHPAVVRELGLARRGLELLPCEPALTALGSDGRALVIPRDVRGAAESIARISRRDAERWPAFVAFVARAARFLEAVYDRPPPDPTARGARGLAELARVALRLRRQGRREMSELLKALPMAIADLLDDWFESDLLKGGLALRSVRGVFQGPLASGTAYLFFDHHLGTRPKSWNGGALVRGGTGNLAAALAEAARAHGAEIRMGTPVERVSVSDGRAVGVVTEDGVEIAAGTIVSGLDPRRTYLDLVGPAHLEPDLVRAVRNVNFRGAVAKVSLALGEAPRFERVSDGVSGPIVIAPSLEYIERAYDDAKYGAVSRDVCLEATVTTLGDPTRAPEGKHVLEVLVQYVPYDATRAEVDGSVHDELADRVIELLSRHVRNLASSVVERRVTTPADLEETLGLTEGNIYHGEMGLDRILFMRPVPGWSRYRTPIRGLYLCGAGTHPGGGVTGAPGYHAARAVLGERGERARAS